MAVDMGKVREMDSHWGEVMEMARRHGFVRQAFGGAAVLLTNENQLLAYGEERYAAMQEGMSGLCAGKGEG